MCEWSSLGDSGAGRPWTAAGGGGESLGGIWSASPRRLKSGRRGVTGREADKADSPSELSSLAVRREASAMCGEGESFPGVPPPSDMERGLDKGDRSTLRAPDPPRLSPPSARPESAAAASSKSMSHGGERGEGTAAAIDCSGEGSEKETGGRRGEPLRRFDAPHKTRVGRRSGLGCRYLVFSPASPNTRQMAMKRQWAGGMAGPFCGRHEVVPELFVEIRW